MKRMAFLFIIPLIFVAAQDVTPVRSYFGLIAGLNYSNYDPKDNAGNLSGMGFQIGLGMGIEIGSAIGIQIAPMFRTTSFNRPILGVDTGANFDNLYLPLSFQLKAGMIPVISPYLGIGMAGNFQLSGTAYLGEIRSTINNLENDLLFTFSLGTDIKLKKMKVSPEFSFNYNLSADDPDTQNRTETNYDFHFSVGFFYTP
ncbi:MAG: outer membrane beta-barrel protein [candidate division WOR-3 bacterium]